MTFFNKKEDVLKIELTPHGRKLLSMGKMKPMFYSFLDDDILYDISRGGGTETNSQTKTRILTDTPYLKPQTNYKGVDTSVRNIDEKEEQTKYLQHCLGTGNQAEKKTPGWNVTCLLGEIESSQNTLTSSTSPTLQIPQLEYQVDYRMSVNNVSNTEQSTTGLLFSRDLPVFTKPDGSYVDINEEQLLLNIFERNGFFHKDSYEIEVYLFEQDETSLDRKLRFFDQDNQLKNGMLVEERPVDEEGEITNEFVEYYLDISVDKEISQEDICKGLSRLKAKEIFLDLEVKCPDREDNDVNIYGSRVTPEDLEEC